MTYEKLLEDMKSAMLEKNALKKLVLANAITSIRNAAIAKRCKDNITEELVNEVLLKEKKTLQEMIDTCPKDRPEILDNYTKQYLTLIDYVPVLITDEETIADAICGICEAEGIELVKSNKGKVMKAIMPSFKGKMDMTMVNRVVGVLLQ